MEEIAGRLAGPTGRSLVVANRLPYPLDDGWKRRTFHLLRAIGRDRPVTLVSLHGGRVDAIDELRRAIGIDLTVRTVRPPRLRSLTAAALGGLTRTPYHVWRQRSSTLRDLVSAEVAAGGFDLAVATLAHLYPYIRELDAVRVVDTHNIDSLVLDRYADTLSGVRSAYARMTARKLRDHETAVFDDADLVFVCSDAELDRVRNMTHGANAVTVPNGVDSREEFRPLQQEPAPGRIVFFGRLDYYPNIDGVRWFASEVLPHILSELPEAEVRIVGPGASADLTSLSGTSPGLRFTGRVDDLRAEVAKAAVVVVPLRVGGGTRLKILEALSLERAVVSTPIGAEGLELTAGQDIVFAEDARGFAEAVVGLIRDPALAEGIGQAGRRTVVRRYDWSIIEDEVNRHLARTAAQRIRSAPVEPLAAPPGPC